MGSKPALNSVLSLSSDEVAAWAGPLLALSPYDYPGAILLTNTDSKPQPLLCGCFLKGWDLPYPEEQLLGQT